MKKRRNINGINKSKQIGQQKPFVKTTFLYPLLLIIIISAVFFNATKNHFTNWDDIDYVTENTHIRELSAQGVKNIFSVYVSRHYHPLTLLSLAVDFKIWGLNARGFIMGNILLHILNALLVLFIIRRLKFDYITALTGALIFALHPMRIESVIWVSERKDVLYVFFYLLAIYQYIIFLNNDRRRKNYILVIIFAILSILSKASAASLPLILLAFDYLFERKDYKNIIVEKVPLLLISLILGLVAVNAQSDAVQNTYPATDKLFMFTYALCFYLFRFVFPFRHTPLFEFPEKTNGFLPLEFYLSVLIIPLLVFVYFKLKTHRKAYLFSMAFFIASVLLVLIKYPVGPAYLAERYTYLPYLGLTYLLIYFCYNSIKGSIKPKAFYFIVPWLLFLGIRTYSSIPIWTDSITLWTHVISYKPSSIIAYNNRGIYKDKIGDFKGAIEDFTHILSLDSVDAMAYYNRGLSLKNLGNFEQALNDLNKAVTLKPQYDAYYYRANVKGLLGDYLGAIEDFNTALTYTEKELKALTGRATARMQMGDFEGAINDYNTALLNNPSYPDALMGRGNAFALIGDYTNALIDLNAAAEISPETSEIFFIKGLVFSNMNNMSKACEEWLKASKLDNSDAIDLYNEMCTKN